MNNTYDLHTRSKQYRREALHEVRIKQLEGRLHKDRETQSERGSVSLALASALSLVRRA